ncbi:Retrotransposable element Tf2, partial [Brachionus plicatilis]
MNTGTEYSNNFCIEGRILCYKGLQEKPVVVIPQQLVTTLLDYYHSSYLSHVGRDKMFQNLRKKFYWAGMYKDIRRWVQACITCNK